MKPPTPLAKRELEYVFLISIGRAGSTVVNAILNDIDGYCIRGENYGALFPLFQSIRAVQKIAGRKGTSSADKPFFGASDIRPKAYRLALLSHFVDHVLRPPEGTRVTGFKEIRFGPNAMQKSAFLAYLDFLSREFPNAKLIFNVRAVEAVMQSGWWAKKDEAKTRRNLTATRNWFVEAAEARPNAFLLEYETYSGNPDGFAPLFAFLEEPFDRARVAAILSTPLTHGKQDAGREERRRAANRPVRNATADTAPE